MPIDKRSVLLSGRHLDVHDLMVYGLTRLAATLLEPGLVDRLQIAVHPVLVLWPHGDAVARRW